MSAETAITPVLVAVLLAGVGSAVADVTVPALVTEPDNPLTRATFSTNVEVAAAARPVAWVQVSAPVPVDGEHTQPEPVAPVRLRPAGSVSVMVRGPAASDGPLLVTSNW